MTFGVNSGDTLRRYDEVPRRVHRQQHVLHHRQALGRQVLEHDAAGRGREQHRLRATRTTSAWRSTAQYPGSPGMSCHTTGSSARRRVNTSWGGPAT